MGELLDQVQGRLLPVIESVERSARSFAAAMGRLERGEGSVGRLLTDDTLVRDAEAAARRVSSILETLEGAADDARRLAAAVAGADGRGGDAEGGGGVPALLRRADQTLSSLQRASRDLARATPSLPRATRSVEQGAGSLPALLVQTQETARELELLVEPAPRHVAARGRGRRRRRRQRRPRGGRLARAADAATRGPHPAVRRAGAVRLAFCTALPLLAGACGGRGDPPPPRAEDEVLARANQAAHAALELERPGEAARLYAAALARARERDDPAAIADAAIGQATAALAAGEARVAFEVAREVREGLARRGLQAPAALALAEATALYRLGRAAEAAAMASAVAARGAEDAEAAARAAFLVGLIAADRGDARGLDAARAALAGAEPRTPAFRADLAELEARTALLRGDARAAAAHAAMATAARRDALDYRGLEPRAGAGGGGRAAARRPRGRGGPSAARRARSRGPRRSRRGAALAGRCARPGRAGQGARGWEAGAGGDRGAAATLSRPDLLAGTARPPGRRLQDAASPTVSATTAPRAPSGFARPRVVSTAVWRSISAFSSAPTSTTTTESQIQVMNPTPAPSEP